MQPDDPMVNVSVCADGPLSVYCTRCVPPVAIHGTTYPAVSIDGRTLAHAVLMHNATHHAPSVTPPDSRHDTDAWWDNQW
jgi:hypothetical protein